METSEQFSAIAKAFVQAQKEIKNPTLNKENPFFKGSKYADLASGIDACKGPLNKAGIALVQHVDVRDSNHVVVTLTLLHESGEWFRHHLTLVAGKSDPQGIGSTITYARRYQLFSAMGMVGDEDDDGDAGSTQQPKPQAKSQAGGLRLPTRAEVNKALQNCKTEDEFKKECGAFQAKHGKPLWEHNTGHKQGETFGSLASEHKARILGQPNATRQEQEALLRESFVADLDKVNSPEAFEACLDEFRKKPFLQTDDISNLVDQVGEGVGHPDFIKEPTKG